MDMQPSALPGSAVTTGPLGHDYWKRAVYRAAPRHFSVEMLPPAKLGSSYSYGIRVDPAQAAQPSNATIRSTMNSSYEIWRKWEDCLWFQDTLELQYSVLSRQKRQRLINGKGVKKNGIYIHDQASSWESLPPGPDPKSVKKDIHDYLPRLTKRGTLFRTSTSTVEQRHAELTALVHAFLSEDVPALIEELREERTIRDFFGYWRRDHDLLLKRNPPRKPDPSKQRKSLISGIGAWSAPFASSVTSLGISADVPPSPTNSISSFAPGSSSSAPSSSESGSSINGEMPPSPRTGVPASSMRGTSRGAPTEASFTTSRSRLVPDMNVVTIPPPSHLSDALSQTRSSITASSRPRSHSVPQKPQTYNVSEDFPLFLSASTREMPPQSTPTGHVRTRVGGLEALPEEQEQEFGAAFVGVGSSEADNAGLSTPPLIQRRRAQSSAAASHRTVVVREETFAQPDGANDSSFAHDMSSVGHESDADPGLSSSSATVSTASLQSPRSSWRTAPRSRPSSSGSAVSGIDIDLSGFLSATPPSPEVRARHHHRAKGSIVSVDSIDAVIPRRAGRVRSNSQPLPIGVEENVDSWIELGDDFIDAYFDLPSTTNEGEAEVPEDDLSQELDAPNLSLDVPYTAVPTTPHESVTQTIILPDIHAPDVPLTAVPPTSTPPQSLTDRRQQVAISLSSELFSQPFRDSSASSLQFHLPFTPSTHTPDVPSFPSSPAVPTFFATPPSNDAVVIKAAHDDAIVSFRLPRCTPLRDVRARVADKFSHTEGIQLAPGFALAYVPPVGNGRAGARETLIRESTASAATTDWSRQATIESDEDWAIAVATCGPKLVLRVAGLESA